MSELDREEQENLATQRTESIDRSIVVIVTASLPPDITTLLLLFYRARAIPNFIKFVKKRLNHDLLKILAINSR
jgi:hypothetical protein